MSCLRSLTASFLSSTLHSTSSMLLLWGGNLLDCFGVSVWVKLYPFGIHYFFWVGAGELGMSFEQKVDYLQLYFHWFNIQIHQLFCLSVFVLGDEIRRLVTESIVPYLTEKGHVWKIQRDYAKSKKDSEEKTFIPSQVNALICSSFIYHYNANIATSCIIVFFGFNFSLFLMQFNYIFGLLVVWS